MSNKGKYYITTAIAYTSGKPHIGNTYEIILADSIARYQTAGGIRCVLPDRDPTSMDRRLSQKAQEAGVTPKEFVDKTSAEDSPYLGSDEHVL